MIIFLNKLTDEDSIIAQKSLLNPIKLFGFLDKLVANLETTALVPVQQRSQEIVNNFQNLFNGLTVNDDDLKSDKTRISDLITAAINYFFGGRNNYQLDSKSSAEKLINKSNPQQVLTPNHQLNYGDSLGDNWLTWNDLFGETNTNIEESVQQPKWGLPGIRSKIGQKASKSENEEFPETDSQTSQGFNFKPDWIDISATSLGYEKHPLEQILQWLN